MYYTIVCYFISFTLVFYVIFFFLAFSAMGKVPRGMGDIVNGVMVAMWPTDDMDNDGRSFCLGDVVECNLAADTVTVVRWEV